MPGNATWIANELRSLRETGLLRELRHCPSSGGVVVLDGRPLMNLSSNDYLDLANHPGVKAAAARCLDRYGAGATASRLVVGSLDCHEELERRLARFKRYPACLVFGSGYAANVGAIPALAGRNTRVFLDRAAHASIVDGAVLSRARIRRFRHNDWEHLDSLLSKTPPDARRLVVTESVFSMDGDLAPLPELASVAGRRDAMLMVDEAHATGVFGPGGAGLVARNDMEPSVDVCMGTLSKALAGAGAYVACSTAIRDLLVNRARAFVYSTALPPASVGSALGALDALARDPAMGQTLQDRASRFREKLRSAGLDTGRSQSQIVPLVVGDAARALRLAAHLRNEGILAVAIRPPTVPAGTARIRFSLTLAHSQADLDRAAETVAACARQEGLP
jgi:8-amino-7-oxononanoate synthase